MNKNCATLLLVIGLTVFLCSSWALSRVERLYRQSDNDPNSALFCGDDMPRFEKGNIPWSKGKKWKMPATSGSKHWNWKGEGGFQKGHRCFTLKHSEASRKNNSEAKKGKKNPMWNGGKTKDRAGYILVSQIEHPFCNARGYVRAHRLVVEKQIGRYLLPEEHIHHLNEIKDDNCKENLIAFATESAHQRFHVDPHSVKVSEMVFDGRKLCQS